jgi:ubiquinone/menaquinone biosynthesis C-methylase UbiE
MKPSTIASTQYQNSTSKLTARIALYNYNTNQINWFTWLNTRLPLSGEILEVGSGTGELWKHVDHSHARLTLTDFSPAMCAQLQKLSIPNATVQQSDAASVPYSDESFDGVVANHMIYHVDDPDAVLKELARVLKPGGRIALSMGETPLHSEGHAIGDIGKAIGRPLMVMKLSKINSRNAKDFLEKYFQGVEQELYPINLDIPTADPVLDYLDSLGDEVMSDGQKVEARGLIEKKIEEDGVFKVRMGSVLFTARKQ